MQCFLFSFYQLHIQIENSFLKQEIYIFGKVHKSVDNLSGCFFLSYYEQLLNK